MTDEFDEASPRLSVYVQGEPDVIDASKVFAGLKSLMELVRELVPTPQDGGTTRASWRITDLALGSVSTTIAPVSESGTQTAVFNVAFERLITGFQLTEDEESVPDYWSSGAVDKAKKVASEFAAASPVGTTIGSGSELEVLLTRQSAIHITRVTSRRRPSLGSVRGTLETLTVHKKNEATLWSELTNSRIAVQFDDDLLDEVRAAVKQRVNVHGVIERNYRGEAVSVRPQEIDILPTTADGPNLSDAAGLLSGVVRGSSDSDWWVRGQT